MNSTLRKYLLDSGASAAGFAEVGRILHDDISHLRRAVSIGVCGNMREDTLVLLKKLQKKTVRFLKDKGYRHFCIPPDSDRKTDTFISKLYPLFTHKIAATSAGLGWIGKNGLLISPRFGPRLSLATVLTNAPLESDAPIESSLCGDCVLCVEHCPSGALSGEEWSRNAPFPDIFDIEACDLYKKGSKALNGKPNCGLCINICPYGRKAMENTLTKNLKQ
jgi:epoxyqueuosine reductase QueG